MKIYKLDGKYYRDKTKIVEKLDKMYNTYREAIGKAQDISCQLATSGYEINKVTKTKCGLIIHLKSLRHCACSYRRGDCCSYCYGRCSPYDEQEKKIEFEEIDVE